MNGFVLAGGRSTRMGTDKALLDFRGRPLIEHAVDRLKAAGLQPHIAGTRPDLAGYAPVVADLHPGCGPLGGIEAALAFSDNELNVFIPVDLPLLPAFFLRYLAERAAITGADATVPTVAGLQQPLCAVYGSGLLDRVRRALDAGDYKITRAISAAITPGQMDIFSVEAVSAARSDWPLEPPLRRWFQNINTPADLALIS